MFSCIRERIKILKTSRTVFNLKSCSVLRMWELKIAFPTLSSPRLMKTSDECLSVRLEEIVLSIRKGHRIFIVCSSEPVIEMIV